MKNPNIPLDMDEFYKSFDTLSDIRSIYNVITKGGLATIHFKIKSAVTLRLNELSKADTEHPVAKEQIQYLTALSNKLNNLENLFPFL